MNRRSITIASALFLSVGATRVLAQDMVPHPSFGLLAGANFAKLTGSDANNVSSRTGFVGGVSLKSYVGGHFLLEVDGLYSQEGAKPQSQGDSPTLKLDYIRVPVQLGYRFPTHTSVHPFITVGPSLGFKIACKETLGSNSANCDSGQGTNAKSFDFAGVVGAGIGFQLGHQELNVQGRFTRGFTNVFSGANAKNQNFAIMGGFAF